MTIQNTVSTADAGDLAHTYHLFMSAWESGNHTGVTIYGDWLLSKQTRMGIELVTPHNIVKSIELAHEKLNIESATAEYASWHSVADEY